MKSKNNVPELRFPEFQGDGEWEEKKIKTLFDFLSTATNSRADLSNDGDAYCIHYGDIHKTFHTVLDFSKHVPPKIMRAKASRAEYIKNGDVIFADASEDTQGIGKSIEVVNLNDLAISGLHTYLLRPMNNIFARKFCAYVFQTSHIYHQLLRVATGIKVYSISKSSLKEIQILIPPQKKEGLKEQQKIADCLSSLDEIIHAQTQKVEKLTAHKKGLLQKLFPQEGQRMPEFRFPEFRECGEWEDVTLGENTIKVGSGITPRGGEKNYKKEGRPFVRSQNVGWGELLLEDIVYITDEVHSTFSSSEIFVNDILLNITGASIGRCSLANEQIAGGNVNQHVCIIRVKEDALHSNFTMQYIISEKGQKQIDSFQAGGNRQGLNFAQIRSLKLPLPSFDEQQKIADCLASLDSLILQHTKKLDALKKHKQGLMQGLFPNANNLGAGYASNIFI